MSLCQEQQPVSCVSVNRAEFRKHRQDKYMRVCTPSASLLLPLKSLTRHLRRAQDTPEQGE